MWRLAQKEPIYSVVLCSLESDDDHKEASDGHTLEVNERKSKIPYLKEVQKIMNEYTNVFPKDLIIGLPPQRDDDCKIELIPMQKHS